MLLYNKGRTSQSAETKNLDQIKSNQMKKKKGMRKKEERGIAVGVCMQCKATNKAYQTSLVILQREIIVGIE